uniref:Protein of unassigned function n=1 Tax=Methylobacterium oryzae CBMB20 TaxID=693986 RepID=A0A088B2Y5_9HYPH|nr:protein of unassigned function [Methylobacterium oryzae CBMB20]
MTFRGAYFECAGPMGFWVKTFVALVMGDLLFAAALSIGISLLLSGI